ncbi:MAG: NAD(P)-dependent oxidoreductase [candidate division Zixibacteria bacterium]|nr:NAD(P)-dependent oxidoreductase [candidate division Zixibacteria bacterium]
MTQNNSPILITGGAGYIGSVLVGQLLSDNYRVRVIDNLMYRQDSLKLYSDNRKLEIVHGDIRNETAVKQALEGISAVVHLAAIVGDPACEKNKQLATEVNKEASQMLSTLAKEQKIKRFIFASTCSNYGKMEPKDGYVDETSRLKPISHYARLKVGFEEFLTSQKSDSFSPVILRFATAFGMSPRPRLDLTVNEFTAVLAMGEKLEIYGENFWRPYCHTNDIARACQLMLEADKSIVTGQAFNVGDTSQNYQKKTLIELILKELPEAADKVVFVTKDEDPRDYRVNFDKIKKTLGYKKTKTVSNGICEYIDAIKCGQITDIHSQRYRN